jgi:predicted nucleotidyltransferase
MKFDRTTLEQYLAEQTDVVAAYIFGSAARGDAAVNDFDILVLLDSDADVYEAYTRMKTDLSALLGIPEEQIDILFFDLDTSDPIILHEAIENGILVKSAHGETLGDRIETLSTYLMCNEFLIQRANRLKRERLEAFSGH